MSQCSVDFFDTKLGFVFHDESDITEIDLDYLTPETSEFDISQTSLVRQRQLARIFGRDDFVAVIESVDQNDGYSTVKVKPFLSLFDHPVMFDAYWQHREDIYSERTSVKGKNPKNKGYYEKNEDGTYSLTNDTSPVSGKTYYRRKKWPDWEGTDDDHGSNTTEKSLEQTIKDLIEQYYTNTTDDEQKIPINIITTSSTTDWTFNLVGDESSLKEEGLDDHHCVVEFYDVILQNALTKYRVAVESRFNFVNKRIDITIGAPTEETYFETNLPDLKVIEFTVGKMESDLNKLEIWDQHDYSKTPVYYYLHNDGTYDMDGANNRVTPVKMEVISVVEEAKFTQIELEELSDANPKEQGWYEECDGKYRLTKDTSVDEDESYYEKEIDKSFDEVAKEQADQTFGDIKWRNYAEIEVLYGSTHVSNMRIGQIARIYNNGEWYESVLTGKKLGDVVTLVFGTIRIDMTKKNQLKNSEQYTDNKSITKNSSTSSK